MFALSVITMIGYGNLVPTTRWGKILTIVSTTWYWCGLRCSVVQLYAVPGIPVYILYFMNVGKVGWLTMALTISQVLANLFKWGFRRFVYCCAARRGEATGPWEEILVPSTACVWVMLSYLLLGTVMFAEVRIYSCWRVAF